MLHPRAFAGGRKPEMNDMEPIAHIAEDGRVHGLEERLRGTAELAACFAVEIGCGEWRGLAGVWRSLERGYE
jgi:hypothetical protein